MYKSNNWIIQWVKRTSMFQLSQDSNMFQRAISIYSSSTDYSKYSPVTRVAHVLTVILKPPNKLGVTPVSGIWAFAFALRVRDAWEAQAASRQELEQRPWLCWRLQGARLEIKPNKNVWFVAFIFGRCQLQFELARCLEAGWVTNMKDALMNCWQSSASSLIHYVMEWKTSPHCYTKVFPQLMASFYIMIIYLNLIYLIIFSSLVLVWIKFSFTFLL